jgi:hypothetical protein
MNLYFSNCCNEVVEVKNQLDATKYAVFQFLLPQNVSGTNMPIIRSKISEYLPLLGGHTVLSRYGHLKAEDIH